MSDVEQVLVPLFGESEVNEVAFASHGLPVVSTDGAAYNLHYPGRDARSMQVRRVLRQQAVEGGEQSILGGDQVRLGNTFETAGRTFVEVYYDAASPFARLISRTVWRCVPHGERYISANSGRCPRHDDGVLEPC